MAKRTGTLWEYTKTEGSCNHGFTSFAIKWILSAVCGIIKVDFKNKVIVMQKELISADLECGFTCGKLKIKQGKVLSVPADYKVEYV
jgi:hypothetical protein